MIKTIFHLIRYFPEQVFLFVFNSGVFAWLWTSGNEIANQIDITETWQKYIPAPIQQFFGDNSQAIQSFFNHSAIMWLIGSMIILIVIRLVKGLVKLALFIIILFIGIYLVLQNQEILSAFLHR